MHLASSSLYQASWLWLSNRSVHTEVMVSYVFSFLLLFCCSSTFKDAERASLRDSGHGDSDQADSDQDTNKGSHCDTSAREALKMKATAVNGQPFEQGEWTSWRCLTDSCTRHCLYLMKRDHACSSPVFKWRSVSPRCTHTHTHLPSTWKKHIQTVIRCCSR